jgi:hypothetical protein
VVDYVSSGEPVLQERSDPTPDQTSMEIKLADKWKGRKIDVRIWESGAKLLDSKPVECKASS